MCCVQQEMDIKLTENGAEIISRRLCAETEDVVEALCERKAEP